MLLLPVAQNRSIATEVAPTKVAPAECANQR
jgi:hypothetical protein